MMTARILTYLLAVIFLASGAAKLIGLPFETEAFARWGYPVEFMYLTGVLELAGAVGLLLPRLSALAALCLAALMLGAVGTHVLHAEWVMAGVALAIQLTAFWCGWRGRGEVLRLFGRGSTVR